jgi:hypothetical protein
VVYNSSGSKLQNLLHILVNDYEILVPQCLTHYSPVGNDDVLDNVVHKNIRLSALIVCDILESDHPPIFFHLLDRVRTRNFSDPVDKFTIASGFKAWPLT